jgi:hypothetical protein
LKGWHAIGRGGGGSGCGGSGCGGNRPGMKI